MVCSQSPCIITWQCNAGPSKSTLQILHSGHVDYGLFTLQMRTIDDQGNRGGEVFLKGVWRMWHMIHFSCNFSILIVSADSLPLSPLPWALGLSCNAEQAGLLSGGDSIGQRAVSTPLFIYLTSISLILALAQGLLCCCKLLILPFASHLDLNDASV